MNPGTIRRRVQRYARPLHECATIHLLRGVLVVRPAEQADPVRSVEMRSGKAVLVIEFQGASLGAPPAALLRERAAAAIALVDGALDLIGDVA